MNWLFWAVTVLLGWNIIDGFRKGFIRKSVSAVSLIVTLALVTYLTPQITTLLRDHTPLYQNLQEKCSELFWDEDYDENIKTDQVLMMEHMNLPENIREMLVENNNSEAYDLLGVTGFREYVGAYLASTILDTLAYLLTFILVFAAIRILLLALDIVTMLPILHGINRWAGGALGLAIGVIQVWLLFLLAAILCSGDLGRVFFALICENQFLLFLYEHNMIMQIVFGLIF